MGWWLAGWSAGLWRIASSRRSTTPAALSAGVWVHLILIEATGGPGALLALTFVVVASLGVALLMAVMRGLLAAAIADRAELAEVI